jgi:hypothetical protein
VSRSRGFSRRINVNLPASPHGTAHNDKENMGCGGGTPVAVTPEVNTLPFSQQISSPSKVRIMGYGHL